MPRSAEFSQLWNGTPFIHPSGEHYTQTCCDCGSTHNIKLTVLNGEEIEVLFFANDQVTRDARKEGCNGRLVSNQLHSNLLAVIEALGSSKNKKALKLLKRALLREAEFEAHWEGRKEEKEKD